MKLFGESADPIPRRGKDIYLDESCDTGAVGVVYPKLCRAVRSLVFFNGCESWINKRSKWEVQKGNEV